MPKTPLLICGSHARDTPTGLDQEYMQWKVKARVEPPMEQFKFKTEGTQ